MAVQDKLRPLIRVALSSRIRSKNAASAFVFHPRAASGGRICIGEGGTGIRAGGEVWEWRWWGGGWDGIGVVWGWVAGEVHE